MNALWFIGRSVTTALITVILGTMVMKKLTSKPSNLAAGAMHFKKGLSELQKGARAILFGPPKLDSPEVIKARRESARIKIE
jgi:hypothetical protein